MYAQHSEETSKCTRNRDTTTQLLQRSSRLCVCNVKIASERQVDTTASQILMQAESWHETWGC